MNNNFYYYQYFENNKEYPKHIEYNERRSKNFYIQGD